MNFWRIIDIPRKAYSRFQSVIWVITAIQVFTFTGFSICTPFISLYLHQDRGLSMTLVGTIILVGGICSAATQLVGGTLSDRFGRRPTLLVFTTISVLLYSGLAVVIGIASP
ncbi:MFS transporter, partial [Chloroflexota bacterium]